MAVQFDGATQGLSVVAPRSQFQNVIAWSVCCWARIETVFAANGVMMKFSTNTGGNTTRVSLAITTAFQIEVGVRILDGDPLATFDVSPIVLPNPGEWHHYAITFDCNTRTLVVYYDGFLLVSAILGTLTAGPTTNAASLTGGIGVANPQGGGNSFWPGSLEDMKFFNRILSTNEIMTIVAQKGRDSIWSGLTSFWPMNDLGPGVAVSVVADVSTNHSPATNLPGTPKFIGGITQPKKRMYRPRRAGF